MRGALTTFYCATKGTLLSALGLGPSYKLLLMEPKASKGLEQVRVALDVVP